MIRIVHTADVHLGSGSGAFGTRAEKHQALIREAFARCIDLAVERQAQAVVIAGDLFDSPRPSQRVIDFARGQFKRLNDARPESHVFILPGTHDCVTPGGLWRNGAVDSGLANVHILSQPEAETTDVPALGLAVHGRAQQCSDDRHEPLQGLKPRDGMVNVALAHGSVLIPGKTDADGSLIKPDALANCGMNYVALGHWHSPYGAASGAVTAWYSGSPEVLVIDQAGAGFALVVDVDGTGPARVEQVKTGALDIRHEIIDLAEVASEQDVIARLATLADSNRVLDVALVGVQSPGLSLDMEHLMEELEHSFFRLRFRDNSELPVDPDNIPDEQIAGRFVALAAQRLQRAQAEGDERSLRVAQRALQLGTALLAGKKVLA